MDIYKTYIIGSTTKHQYLFLSKLSEPHHQHCFDHSIVSSELIYPLDQTWSIWSFYLLTLTHPLMITIKDKCSKWYLEDEEESINAAQRFKTHHLSSPTAALFFFTLFAGFSNRVPFFLCVRFGLHKIFLIENSLETTLLIPQQRAGKSPSILYKCNPLKIINSYLSHMWWSHIIILFSPLDLNETPHLGLPQPTKSSYLFTWFYYCHMMELATKHQKNNVCANTSH